MIGAHAYPYDGGDRGRKPDDGGAAQLRGFGEAYPASVYSVCAKTLPEYERTTATIPPDGTARIRNVQCDPSALSITAAGSRGPASVREVAGSDFYPYRWEMSFANHGDTPREVSVLGVCSTLDPEYVHAPAPNAAAESQTYADAECPASGSSRGG